MKDLYADTAATKTESKKGKKVANINFQGASKVLVRPLVTEKATNLAAESKYVFVVHADANKISVAKSIQAIYGVKPLDVNMVNMKGKQVARGRIKGKRKDWKKAIVTLKKGETIAIYEGV
ncbi:50S ribosomal protein L23 [Candidatus Falkowbacteria bacterium]|nr:50S ribosomal protein L23 [Candidatus Falkowbacteria bacterium]